jgi:hypothetical protein
MTLTAASHVRVTKDFIDGNPSTVTFKRRPRVSDGAGGWTWGDWFDSGTYVVRIVGLGTQEAGEVFTSPDGTVVNVAQMLIAMPDMDIRANDQFVHEGKLKEVLITDMLPPWRLQGKVMVHGV